MIFCLFFLFFVIVGCSLDTGLLSSDEMRQIVSGAIVQGSEEENKLVIKVCLKFITMCCNISDIRIDAMDSAFKSTFLSDDDNGSTDGGELTDTAGKCCKVMTTDVNEGVGKVGKTIDVDVVVPDKYELHDFSITDQGVISFDRELMFE